MHCDYEELLPYFRLTSPNYLDNTRGSNWFDYFFELQRPLPVDPDCIRIRTIGELGLPRDYNSLLNFQIATGLFYKYLRIKDEILHSADEYWQRNLGSNRVLGIHYRGSDKTLGRHAESHRVSYNDVFLQVEKQLQDDLIDHVFVASDEKHFVDAAKRRLPGYAVFACDNQEYAVGRFGVHKTQREGGEPYRKGREALIDCLLLSKCCRILKTSSRLSAFARILSPDLKIVMLSKPLGSLPTFPERDLIMTDQAY